MDPAAEARRQRAIQLLAKALKKPGDRSDHSGARSTPVAANSDAESAFLRSLLEDCERGAKPSKIAASLRDRLSVLGIQRGDLQVAAALSSKHTPNVPDDHTSGSQQAAQLPALLERLKAGDMSAVSTTIRTSDYWRTTAGIGAAYESASQGKEELLIPPEDLEAMRRSLNQLGYGALQPGSSWGYGALAPVLGALRAAAGTLRAAGWPPAFVFMLDEAWELLDRLFEPMEAILGEGCRMDPSVFCWIAATPPALNETATAGRGATSGPTKPTVASESPAPGANFGVPHRDFTCLQSLRQSDGAPLVLSLWLPLNDVNVDNGCMMVLPRPLDRHFFKRFAYAHMRPALPAGEDADAGAPTEVRFELAAARPLAPLRAGSIAAWVGNLVHWGTCCLPTEGLAARASVGFNFLAAGERLQSTAPLLARADAALLSLDERLAIVARSLLAYSPWYALIDTAVPTEFYAT